MDITLEVNSAGFIFTPLCICAVSSQAVPVGVGLSSSWLTNDFCILELTAILRRRCVFRN